MKKISTSCTSLLSRFLMILTIVCFSSSWAQAAQVDLGALVVGETYNVPGFSSVSATFTAPATGTLTIKGGGLSMYTDAEHTNLISGAFTGDYSNGGTYTYPVVENTTYYLFNNFTMGNYSMILFMDGVVSLPLEIQIIEPSEHSSFNFANYNNLVITFNQAIKTANTTAKIAFKDRANNNADYSINQVFTLNDKTITVPVFRSLKSMLTAGRINPGDEFTIGIKGLSTTNDQTFPGADSDGYVYFSFLCGSIPVNKVSETVPAKFLSYWPKGAAEGKISLTFDKELGESDKTQMSIGYGNLEGAEGEYYYEVVPVEINGSTLTADFTGKLRTPITMTPLFSETKYNQISVHLSHVVDTHGNPVASEGQGTVGSFDWVFEYEELPRANVSAEFTPANGGSLNGVNEISVYIQGLNSISFSGFNISYKDGQETKSIIVDKADATVSEASADGSEASFTFTIPAEVKGKTYVTVTLANIDVTDGYDHSSDISATYDGFVITYADPANGSQLAGLGSGDVLTIHTNYSELYPEMYVVYEIEDLNPEDPTQAIMKYSWLNRKDDGSYSANVYGKLKFLIGHRYKVTFTAWENEMAKNYGSASIGSSEIFWEGTTAPFRYSDLLFVSITPDESTVLNATDREFTVVFDGLVTLNSQTTFINTGMGTSAAFESIVPVEPTEYEGVQYANTWKLTVSEIFMNALDAPLEIAMQAVDMTGLILKGNNGSEENSYTCFSYNVKAQYSDFDIEPADGSTVEKISEIVVMSEEGIMPSYNLPLGDAVVMNMFRDIVASVASVQTWMSETEGGSDELNTKLTLILDTEITATGNYIIQIPQGYFAMGTQFDAHSSAEKIVSFSIKGGLSQEDVKVELTPAEGLVESLPAQIKVAFTNCDGIAAGSGKATLTINDGTPAELPDLTFDWDDPANMMIQPLGQAYTENGTYVLHFPAGYFLMGNEGDAAPELTFTYYIGEAPRAHKVTLSPAEGEVTSLPSQIKVQFDDANEVAANMGKATMTVNGGDPIVLPDLTFDWDDPLNILIQPLEQAYTEAGTYVITFPAGYILINGSTESKELVFTYTIKDLDSIGAISTDHNGNYCVYNLYGVKVLETRDSDDLKNLTPGLYIINGEKVLVK